eukprot:TRINITY_DN262_c0_g1_i1.p1 TRINITY_DN262_c0_g1~~TRINITY_DN262_c0_g1_i1.p1  ORF type:complete len:100 (-),score=7.90 TRINITY_DN262_c0_g1_i1:416-715(-)
MSRNSTLDTRKSIRSKTENQNPRRGENQEPVKVTSPRPWPNLSSRDEAAKAVCCFSSVTRSEHPLLAPVKEHGEQRIKINKTRKKQRGEKREKGRTPFI